MADRAANKKWAEDEKIKFLVQAVKQMIADGGKINFKTNYVEGRTPKALMHLWDKLKETTTSSQQDGDSGDVDSAGPAKPDPSTPAPALKRGSATPGSRKRTAKTAMIGEGDADELPATPTVKRQRKAPAKSKAKSAPTIQAADEDESEDNKPEFKMEQYVQDNFQDGVV
ncbi:hypothetical protein F4680DRAFT_469779 [Xylaria scruposa]|nr:hypothetical protein F4680DRAFT_469779 [Xylaria scruposa]